MADPYWKPETVMDSNKGKSEIVLAVDLSPSMKGWGGIDEAKNKALSILETSEDEVGLVLLEIQLLSNLKSEQKRMS